MRTIFVENKPSKYNICYQIPLSLLGSQQTLRLYAVQMTGTQCTDEITLCINILCSCQKIVRLFIYSNCCRSRHIRITRSL